jgi:hypothetical protein
MSARGRRRGSSVFRVAGVTVLGLVSASVTYVLLVVIGR